MKGRALRSRLASLVALGFLLALAGDARAATSFLDAATSSDVDVDPAGTTFRDEDVPVDDLVGGVLPATLRSLPEQADVTGYGILSNGDQLFSLDTGVTLPGPLDVRAADVIRYDGASYTMEFDASAEGIPDGVRVDAVSISVPGDLLLSFDTTVILGAVTAADEDLVAFDGASFILVLDGSGVGVAGGLDLDRPTVYARGARARPPKVKDRYASPQLVRVSVRMVSLG